MASTVNDFWRMVWEQRSTIVVMLTDLQENGAVMPVKHTDDFFCRVQTINFPFLGLFLPNQNRA